MRKGLVTWWTLSRWRILAARREFLSDAVGTLQGRLMLLIIVLAMPGTLQLLMEGGLAAGADLDDAARLGVLLVSHAALAICFAAMLPVLLVKRLVIQGTEEPLASHPTFLPDLRLQQVLGNIVGTSVFLWAFYYLFFGRILFAESGGSWVGLGLHLTFALLYFTALGIGLSCLTRKLLPVLAGGPGLERLHLLGILPFLASFPLFVLLPNVLHASHPEWLRVLGRGAPSLVYLLQPQLALATAVGSGLPISGLIWAVAILFAVGVSMVALLGWRRHAVEELASARSPGSADRPRRRLVFPGHGPLFTRQLRAFWAKDVAARPLRGLLAAIPLHVTLLIASGLGTVALTGDPLDVPTTNLGARMGVHEILMVVVAMLAMTRTLGALGEEGEVLHLLRTRLRIRRLCALKWAMNSVDVMRHSLVHVVGVAVAAAWVGRARPGVDLAVVWIASALAFSALGSALGFLLPDFQGKSIFLPGATRAARLLFVGIGGLAISICAAGGGSAAAVRSSAWSAGSIHTLALAALMSIAVAVAAWGIRRAQRAEL